MLHLHSAFRVHNEGGNSLGFFPDGQTLFSAAQEWNSDEQDYDQVLKVWRPDGTVVLSRREYNYELYPAVSGDGQYIAWGGGRSQLRLIRCDQSEEDQVVLVGGTEQVGAVDYLCFLPDSHTLMFVWKQQWWRWEVTTPWPGRRFEHAVASLLAISPDGRRLALCTVSNDALFIEYWDMVKERPLARVEPREAGRRVAAWHPSRPLLATCGYWDEGVELWDFTDLSAPQLSFADRGGYRHAAFLPDGRLVTGHESGQLAVWDVDTGRRLASASTGQLGELRLLEEEEQITITSDKPGVASVAVSPDGSNIAAMTYGGTVAFYTVE